MARTRLSSGNAAPPHRPDPEPLAQSAARVIPFPLSAGERRRNTMGARYVECLRSVQWMQFVDESRVLDGIDYVIVEVMTAARWTPAGKPIKPRKVCDLMVARSELLHALSTVRPRE